MPLVALLQASNATHQLDSKLNLVGIVDSMMEYVPFLNTLVWLLRDVWLG